MDAAAAPGAATTCNAWACLWDFDFWASEPEKSAVAAWGSIATILALAVGVVTILGVWYQTRHAKKLSEEEFANTLYADQLRLDLEYPEYCAPDYDLLRKDGRLLHYETYLSHLLWSLDEILRTTRWDEQWQQTAKYYIAHHHRYVLRESAEGWAAFYDKRFADFMIESASDWREVVEPETLAIFESFARRPGAEASSGAAQ